MKKTSKIFLGLCLVCIASLAHAETPQQFCDQMNRNTQAMYRDLTSAEFSRGQITYDQLAQNYARQTTAFTSRLNLELLKLIYDKRNEVSAQDVNLYIYGRCENDYRNLQAWWKSNRHGLASDYLAPSF